MLRAKMLKNAWVGAFSLKLGREEKVMSQRCSFFAQLMGLIATVWCAGTAWAADVPTSAAVPGFAAPGIPAPSAADAAASNAVPLGSDSVEMVDSHALKRASRALEELFQDELNDLNAVLSPEATDEDISRFEPPPPTTTFRRVWKSKGSLRSNGEGHDWERALARSKAHNPDLVVPYIGDSSSANSTAIRVGFDDQILGFDSITGATLHDEERLENEDLSALQTAALMHATESAGSQVPSFGPAREGATAPNFSQCPMGHQWRIAVMRFGTNYYYDEQFYQTITGLIAHKLIDTSRLQIEQGPYVRTTIDGRTYSVEGINVYDVVAYDRSSQEKISAAGFAQPPHDLGQAFNFGASYRSAFNNQDKDDSLAQEVISGLTADPYANSVAQGLENRRIGLVGTEQAPKAPLLIASDDYKLWHSSDDKTHRSDYYMPLFKNFAEPSGYAYYVDLTQDSCFSLLADAYYSSEWDIELHRRQIKEVYDRSVAGEIDMVLVFGLYDISLFDQMHFDIPIIVVGHDQDILYNNLTQGLAGTTSLGSSTWPRQKARAHKEEPVLAYEARPSATRSSNDFVSIKGGSSALADSSDDEEQEEETATPQELLEELGPKADETLGIVTDKAFSLGEFSPYRNIFVHLDPIMQYDDLVNFYHMMGFSKLGVIVDNSHTFRQLHSIEEIRSALSPYNVRTEICTGELISKDQDKARSEFERCTDSLIKKGVEAVYLTRISAISIERLYSQLWPFTSRGIAVMARGSTSEVKAGALMSYSYGYAESFRHYQAQVISSVMNGRSINTLSQYFYPRQLLTVNAKVACMIGWYPPYKDLSKIDITYLDIASN